MAIISQGTFTQGSTATTIRIPLVSDVDWMYVYNQTQIAAASASTGYQFYWQRGFAAGTGIEWQGNAGSNAINQLWLTSGGFTLIDTTNQQPGTLNNGSTGISAISTATPPVATVGSTAGMAAGSVVRLYSTTGATQFGGLDYTVGYNTFNSTHFDLSYAPTSASAATAGSFRVIPYNPIFYPRVRYIASISQATQAVITTTVTHGYQVGQKVNFIIPSVFGMTQLSGIEATIVAVNTSNTVNSFTIDVNTSAFTAFAWPATGNQPFSPAVVVPAGDNTAYATNNNLVPYTGAWNNVAYIGIQLAAGVNSPAGQANDVIYWVAGKSDSTNTITPVPLGL